MHQDKCNNKIIIPFDNVDLAVLTSDDVDESLEPKSAVDEEPEAKEDKVPETFCVCVVVNVKYEV